MIRLIIKKSGYNIKLPGIETILRTPINLDITKTNINKIISYLRSLGITDYLIVSDTEDHQTIGLDDRFIKTEIKKITKPKVKIVEKHDPNVEVLNQKMNTIEDLLKKLMNKTSIVNQTNIRENTSRLVTRKKSDVEKFIPSINTEGMKIKSTSTETKKNDSSEEIDYVADLLRSNLEKQ